MFPIFDLILAQADVVQSSGAMDSLRAWFGTVTFDDPLLCMAIVLIAGVVGGELFGWIHLPKVTGWIATGIIVRQLALPGLDAESLPRYAPFMNFVLGYIAFTVGATLYVVNLRNAGKRIGMLLLFEAVLTPALVGAVMFLVGGMIDSRMSSTAAWLLAAIAVAGAPGTTVLVIQEVRARGVLTKTLVAAIGLIDVVAVGVFIFISTFLGDEFGWKHAALNVGWQLGVAMFIGSTFAALALILTRTVVGPAFLGPTMVAVILGSWGAAVGFGVSGILACTFAGIAATNIRHDTVRSVEAYLTSIGGVLFALFFTLAGMRLNFALVPAAAGLVLLYFLARLIAKSLGAYTAMALAGVPGYVRRYLGIALLPHGGVAVGLILLVQENPVFSEVEELVTTVGLAALAINQLLGPSATRFALKRAGEAHKDRPRLLDFLQEHRITTDLKGPTREDVVRQLSSLLYATSEMPIDQEAFVQRVLERDRQETTCLGEGLMIPHAILEDKDEEIKGVLGISRKGLDLGAPDGRPVHAVLLLATPASQRQLHLEILALFATAITKDENIREQLYHARSPAHAYDVLHADEELNYFLEDAMERLVMEEAELNYQGR